MLLIYGRAKHAHIAYINAIGGEDMNTYMVPREATNENKILFFSPQAAIFAGIGLLIGMLFKFIFDYLATITVPWVKYIGWGIIALLCLIGYALGTFNIPETNALDFFKKTGGEQAYTIIKRVITFNKRKKIYVYERGQF